MLSFFSRPKDCRAEASLPLPVTASASASTFNRPPNALEISLTYSDGHTSQWSGQQNQKGLYVHIDPVREEDGFTTRTVSLCGDAGKGFKVFVLPMARRNAKTFSAVVDKLASLNGDTILTAWNGREYALIADMVRNVVK